MENNRERVLAYNLAKEISNDELVAVSGGSGWNWGRPSNGITGGGSATNDGYEGHADMHWDF